MCRDKEEPKIKKNKISSLIHSQDGKYYIQVYYIINFFGLQSDEFQKITMIFDVDYNHSLFALSQFFLH